MTARVQVKTSRRAVRALLLTAALLLAWPTAALAENTVAKPAQDDGVAVHPLADDDAPHEASDNIDPTDDGLAGGRRRVYRRRVYRTHYRPRHHHHRTNVVVVQRRTPRTRVMARPKRDARISAGLRFTGLGVGDTALSNETWTGPMLGGIGGYVRGKLYSFLGAEFSVDVMGNLEDDYDMLAVPVMAALMIHLLPESPFDVYGLAGGGLMFSDIDYHPVTLGDTTRTYSEQYTQMVGQLGAGLELDIGALELVADLRWLFMQSRPDRDEVLITNQGSKIMTQSRDPISHGLQFTLGIGGNFF